MRRLRANVGRTPGAGCAGRAPALYAGRMPSWLRQPCACALAPRPYSRPRSAPAPLRPLRAQRLDHWFAGFPPDRTAVALVAII
ncbi:hypothetical protein GUJ93_ZPchr0004g38805 [Zizania palustris]|uniref:Uncharacterized protein n=1 Tax=Zizania palustris TaxID=103762 RepID=A0A8J5SJS9_ZIZPA|nr:hypothetical protein GUJ93_ZPchr0004g38805 [Zizania palustris]